MYKICFEVVQGIFFCHIFFVLIIVLKRKWVRILKKGLKITFINPNTEEQIVQAMAGVLAYNLAENDDLIIKLQILIKILMGKQELNWKCSIKDY